MKSYWEFHFEMKIIVLAIYTLGANRILFLIEDPVNGSAPSLTKMSKIFKCIEIVNPTSLAIAESYLA